MKNVNAIVLLSGGMDSSTALYWAIEWEAITVVAAVHFGYGQRGRAWEFAAAGMVSQKAIEVAGYPIPLHHILLPMDQYSHLAHEGADLSPGLKDSHGNPSTFVPGRNLIHLAMTLPLIYAYGAQAIVGGWTQIDVDYPDCSMKFLKSATTTLTLALGAPVDIFYPLIETSKSGIVEIGTRMGVPWELTRSCYGEDMAPCGQCDSCLLRIAAFNQNDMRDPLYAGIEWSAVVKRATTQGYISK